MHEAEDVGLCHAEKPVHMLVTAAGPPLPTAVVCARAWWKQAVANCWGGDATEVLAAGTERPCGGQGGWRVPAGCCPGPAPVHGSPAPLGGCWKDCRTLSPSVIAQLCAGAAQALDVSSRAVVLGWAGAGRVRGDSTCILPGSLGLWWREEVRGGRCRQTGSPSCKALLESGQKPSACGHVHMGVHTCVRAHTARISPGMGSSPSAPLCCLSSCLIYLPSRLGLNPAHPLRASTPRQAG